MTAAALASEIVSVLRRHGYQAWLVGGCVRDLLLGTPPKDYDVATDATPDQLLDKVWDEGTDPFTNTVRMTVMTLRRKLGDPPVVHTVRGAGYRV